MPVRLCPSPTEARAALQDVASAVVIVPIYNAYEDAVQCLEAILRHAPAGTPLLLIDDASTDVRIVGLIEQLSDVPHRIVVLRHRENMGFVRSANEGFE